MDSTFDLNTFIADVTARLEREAALADLAGLLAGLMGGDEERIAAFVRDPAGELARIELVDVTGADVREARALLLAQGRIRRVRAAPEPERDDVLGEVRHTVAHFALCVVVHTREYGDGPP